MNGILGFAELLKQPLLEDIKKIEYIKIIEKSGIRMLNMINDIMIVSKVESGQIEIRLSEKNVNLQIDHLQKFYENEVKHKKLKFIINPQLLNSETKIVTDHDKVYTILTNLINNAIKFTKIGSIEVGYEKKEGFLEYFVKDTGYGINKSQQKMIFERFRRVNETVIRNYEGSGLGLTISKAFTEILGGNIWVESEKGIGSTFFFTVPIEPINNSNGIITTKREIQVEKPKKTIKDLKILIVEDDTISNLLMSIAVEKYAKVILKANNGLEAVETYINNHTIDLILMDINMPIMNGYEATKQIRKFNKNIIIIAQTANGMPSNRDEAIAAGCNDYISKPINIVLLESLIQKYF
jgi:CheY-like chemotaxis protein